MLVKTKLYENKIRTCTDVTLLENNAFDHGDCHGPFLIAYFSQKCKQAKVSCQWTPSSSQ
jgi:hypothetical protein